MAGRGGAGRLWRALRRALRVSYWRRELTTARVLKPAYFTLLLRWFTWWLAVLLGTTGVALPYNSERTPVWLAITGLWLVAQTLYLPLLRPSLPRAVRRSGLVRAIDRGAAVTAFDVLLSGLVIYATGGWGTPFYMYGLASVVMPALLFGYRAALLAGLGFSTLFVLSVANHAPGLERIGGPGAIDGFIGYTLVPTPLALFAAYLGHVMRQLETERDRSRRALAEATALQAVTASGLRHVAQPARFVAETVEQVRRSGRLEALALVYRLPGGRAGDRGLSGEIDQTNRHEEVVGFGPVHELVEAVRRDEPLPPARPWAVRLALGQADRRLGTLVAEAHDVEARRPFLTALAGQVSAALANAHLYAEVEALAAQATAALHKSETWLQLIINNVPVVLFALDREGVFTVLEGKGLEALGVQPGELVGRSAYEVYEDEPAILDHLRRLLAGTPVTGPVQMDGAVLEARVIPLRDQAGDVIGGLGVAIDITERHAAEVERARLAREIHDGIAQSLFMLALNLDACADLVDRDPARLKERLELLTSVARQTLWQIRLSIHDLRPLLQEEHSLRGAIENQVREFRSVSGLNVDLQVSGDEVATAPAIKQALYRVAQEGLANVFKHATAEQVTLTLAFAPAGVRLSIADDGRGFVPPAADGADGRGFGLGNMRERAAELGGRFTVTSEPGRGTRLEVWIPTSVTSSE